MPAVSRRSLLGALATAPLTLLSSTRRSGAQTPVRMLLNSGYSSVNAWFCLADDRGYLKAAGLELTFTAGRGAYTAAGRTADEGFDIGYGDVNALVELVATAPDRAMAVSVPFLRFCGLAIGGWLMARAADIAAQRLVAGASDREFFEAKLASAHFYSSQVLPQVLTLEHICSQGSDAVSGTDVALI